MEKIQNDIFKLASSLHEIMMIEKNRRNDFLLMLLSFRRSPQSASLSPLIRRRGNPTSLQLSMLQFCWNVFHLSHFSNIHRVAHLFIWSCFCLLLNLLLFVFKKKILIRYYIVMTDNTWQCCLLYWSKYCLCYRHFSERS